MASSARAAATALRSLALAAVQTPRSGPVHVYGIDFTGSGLASLEVMPNVGSIVPGGDDERVARLLRMLSTVVNERADRYGAANASSLPEYRELSGKAREPRILVLTKANSRSTVHRPVPLDYVGVKRFDADGEVIGELAGEVR